MPGLTKVIRAKGVTIEIPNYSVIIRGVVKAFMPLAGDYLRLRAMNKIGRYQPGWAPLSPATLERKARRSRMRGRIGHKARRARLYDVDYPLLDLGDMKNSIRSRVMNGHSVAVTAAFPIGQHEQDSDIADFHLPSNIPLPARPLLGPTLEESLDPLTQKLEHAIEVVI